MIRVDVREQYEEAAAVAGAWLASRSAHCTAVELRDHLYATWYAAARTSKRLSSWNLPFVGQLRVAHAGSRRWENGWVVMRASIAGQVLARRGGLVRLLKPGDYVHVLQPGLATSPGTSVMAVDRLDSTELMPGYWVTHSSDWFPARDTLLRVYWNLEPRGAPELTRILTELLPPQSFCLKIPADPSAFNRTDAVVLYLRAPAGVVWRAVRRAHDAVSSWLAPEVPPLTGRLDTGIAIAEHAAAATESYGQHRCRLIAEAVLAAAALRATDYFSAIRQRFTDERIDPDRPWMAPRFVAKSRN